MVHRVGHPLWLGQVMEAIQLECYVTYRVYWLAHGSSWHTTEELQVVE